jgi:hypothetical protein
MNFNSISIAQRNATTTGLQEYDWSRYAPPTTGVTDGQRFTNNLLRASVEQNPSGLTAINYGGRTWLQIYVNPRLTPASTDPSYPYHFRSEFSEHPWELQLPLNTEEWLGWSYYFPADYKRPIFPMSVFQCYARNSAGADPGGPVLQFEFAGSGQTIAAQTGATYNCRGGEFQVIQQAHVNTTRRVVFNNSVPIRPQAGDRLDFVVQMIYGDATGSTATLRVWINGVKVWDVTNWRTVWIDKNPAVNYKGPNFKIGLYCHSNRTLTDIQTSEAAGILYERILCSNVKRLRRFPGQVGYNTTNAFHAVSTASF